MSCIAFDARLYTRKAVERAVADHAEAAELSLDEKEGFLIVNVKTLNGGLDFEEFEGEFSNYVLGVSGS